MPGIALNNKEYWITPTQSFRARESLSKQTSEILLDAANTRWNDFPHSVLGALVDVMLSPLEERMAEISATFKSNYSEFRHWVILDRGRDPNSPLVIVDGYLRPNELSSLLPLCSDDGSMGTVIYQRADVSQQIADSVTDGSQVSMD